jgi:tetratricopeptide (TPR) repeat protein
MDNSTEHMYERLVDYVDNVTPDDQRPEVEALLATDPAWKEAWQQLLMTRAAIKQYGLKEQVAAIHTELKGGKGLIRTMQPSRRIIRTSMSVAATLLLIIGGYLVYNFYTLSPEKVLAHYYSTYQLPELRSGNSQTDSLELAYKEGNYRAVPRYFKGSDTNSTRHRFLVANAWYETGNTEKAIAQYQVILRDSGSLFHDESEYYLAMAYIANKDFDLALPLLRKIRSDRQHSYYKDVDGRLIRQVKMLKWR